MSVPAEGRMLREMTEWATSDTAQDRVNIEVVTSSGRATAVQVRVRVDLVEVWVGQHCCGVFDRDRLRAWLTVQPRTPLIADDVAFSIDPIADQDERVAISVPGVLVWSLSPMDLQRLTNCI